MLPNKISVVKCSDVELVTVVFGDISFEREEKSGHAVEILQEIFPGVVIEYIDLADPKWEIKKVIK